MRRIETNLEFTTVLNKMTESETIQAETDNGVTHTITDTKTSVKCSGNIDDSIVMKITDEVVKNNIVTSHNNELDVDSKNNVKSEQNNELNTTEIAQLNGIENNVQKKEGYCENNHVNELIMEVSEVNQKDDNEKNQTESSTKNIQQFNIKTTADRDIITDATLVAKDKWNDNLDCNDGATMQTEDIEQFNTKTTADIDTVTESNLVSKENGNDNLDCNDSATMQAEYIEQFNTKTTADIDTVTESTLVSKENGNDNLDCNYSATMQAEYIEQFNTKTTADIDTVTESTLVSKENGNDNDSATMQAEYIEQFNTKTTADIDTVTESTLVSKENGNDNDSDSMQAEYIEQFTAADIDTVTESTPVDKEKDNDNLDCNYGTTMQIEDIEQFNTKTTADIDTIADPVSENKEKRIENPDFNDGVTVETKDIEQFDIKTTAAIDTVTESTPVDKEKGNNNLDCNDGTTMQTEEIEQLIIKTTANVDTIVVSTSEHKEKGNIVVMGDMDSVLDSEKNHIMDDNNSNADNVDNEVTKTVDILHPKIDAIKDTDNAINEDDILIVMDSKLEDNGNSNDTITIDNEYLSIKRTEDDSEDNFDKDDMAALVYSNSESEDANDHVSSECESISNTDDKILYENEDSGDSMEVTETAISASVTEAIARLTDSPVTTVLDNDLMEVTDTEVFATITNADSHNQITTVPQDDSMEVTETAISASATEAGNCSSITTVLIEDAGDVKDLFINKNPDDVQELKPTTVEIGSDIDTDCMEIDNESKVVPEHSLKLADCNDITEGDNKHLSTVNTEQSTPLQEEPGFNLDTKSHNDKTEETNCKDIEKVADNIKQSDKNVDFNSKEEDNNKPNALENVSDIDCIYENDANQSREKHADNNTYKFCSDTKIDNIEKEPSEEKNVTDISENHLIINKSVIPDTSTQQVENIIIKKKDIASTSCLANTLDILSDDEDEQERNLKSNEIKEKPRFNLEDDDDIMLIDDDSSSKDCEKDDTFAKQKIDKQSEDTLCKDIGTNCKSDTTPISEDKESESNRSILMSILKSSDDMDEQVSVVKDGVDKEPEKKERGPLIIPNFVQSFKSDMTNMTRVDLEEFCLLKIVEGLVDRSNLSEIKTKLKSMVQHVEEWRKKAMMLTKQNRDLQIVLKTVQEDQKKRTVGQITPLRITRSVGMQVFMNENVPAKRPKAQHALQNKHRPPSSPQQKAPKAISIPVPRLVPATNNSPLKTIKSPPPQVNSNVNIPIKPVTTPQAVARTIIPQTKASEKRPHNNSVTVDLTDDEPPNKLPNVNKTPPQKFRLVPSQQLMQSTRMTTPAANTRKVYIPISGTQNQSLVPGQTIVFKSISPGTRPRGPTPTRMTTPTRVVSAMLPRHPAPLPEVGKQPRPIHWKPLPPSPELKISKVENGIVISWKIDGYQEDVYEKIASYQLFAYQETTAPPNTLHWKKIGDVKALALPMACTLTQFMAGYKYYFAVRAVDIRSRFGPFSLPGSILLMNKKTD